MKVREKIIVAGVIIMAFALLPCFSLAGSLEPSDPPGPTMYTLEEIFKAVTPLPTGFKLWADNTRFAVSNEGTPEDHSNDVVLDRATGLMWTRDANLDGTKNWQDAVNYCDSLEEPWRFLATDWRLPSIEELTSLSEPYPSMYDPALPAGHPFENVQPHRYWSSTTHAIYSSDRWNVSMVTGHVGFYHVDYSFYVWCVRGGQ